MTDKQKERIKKLGLNVEDFEPKKVDPLDVIKAQGWYTKKDKNVLLILINQKQLPLLSKSIKEIDPKAFMSVSTTNNVYGEGFEEIKTGLKKIKKD